jgi:3-hydroxymyristoyl/3-hydroxydecanoyl-(acyl carrier protein) dehydratase
MGDGKPQKRSIGFTELKKWVRHRYPVHYLDRVVDYAPGEYLTAIVNVSGSMPCITGHFPERAIFPSASALMAFGECGIVLYQLSTRPLRDDEVTLMGGIRLWSRRLIVPGDQLELTVTCDRLRDNFLSFHGTGRVEGEVATEARISLIRKDIADLGPQSW